MKEQLANYLNKYVSFDEKEVDEIYSHLKLQTFKKKEYLLKAGQLCHYKYFITKGLVRSYYINDKGNEHVVLFAIENWWVSNMESYIRETPSVLNIQAIEDTNVLKISKNELEHLYKSVPKMERLFRIITENMLLAVQKKNEFYMKLSGKEKYDSIMQSIPVLIERVPQYMIASYLEMTPEHLSAIRKGK